MLSLTATAQDSINVADIVSRSSVQRLKDGTRVYPDSVIYQGLNIKLDLATSILELVRSKGKVQSYEMSLNCRLKQRYYPTFEFGYAQADITADGGHHKGKGAFVRLGADINGLKKHPERLNALLVGVRIATALQRFSMTDIRVNSPYWDAGQPYLFDYDPRFKFDAWGEICVGAQVQVWEGLQMGWSLRMKILITRTDKNNGPLPAYIPGFGYRDDTNWGINYYIGYHF